MSCSIDQQVIEQVIAFHGHSCPGLAIGIRAAEIALAEFADAAQSDLLCVTETDMCGVDAIQFLTGCTYGKGNLIHRDYGKMAFSFYDRSEGRGIRLLLSGSARGGLDGEMSDLMEKSGRGYLTAEQQERLQLLRGELQRRFMSLRGDELFEVTPLEDAPPRPARILQSLVCESCSESVMESRTRRFGGQTLCIPCYNQVEQKV